MNKDKCVEIRKATSNDLNAIADAHMKVFDSYFLTSLGSKLVKKYYGEYLSNSNTVFFIAIKGNSVVGFVLGTIDLDQTMKYFYKKNFFSILKKISIESIKGNTNIIKGVKERFSAINEALAAILKKDTNDQHRELKVRLMSIGTLSEYRGTNVSSNLVKAFDNELLKRGKQDYCLAFKKDNHRARAFYVKMGFEKNYYKKDLEVMQKRIM
ncbi:GNAT family N-acetyltransferase [Alkalihalobacterium alkalinitrilicum]|uniref:GNAT family N-acetyltransferase n=1 Tax=Alkalihalobacterium alkalinitrilicum TaxID=427920 RepID=UPI00099533D6|nr:GNAT family N-acetyltransferase [Alkalihalobacterium alkalinitrilicum]